MLKKTEGIVTLTVCNPNKKDGEGVVALEGDPNDPSRPVTPKPQPSPAKEVVPHDPLTGEVTPNQNTVIEIKLENQPIGIQVAGGSDTLVNVRRCLPELNLMSSISHDFLRFFFNASDWSCYSEYNSGKYCGKRQEIKGVWSDNWNQ